MAGLTPRLGLDLGTSKILLINRAKKIVFNEPAMLAAEDKTDKVIYYGNAAAERLGKLPPGTQIVCPVRRGAIADYAGTLYLLRRAIAGSLRSRVLKPIVLAGTPNRLTSVEERALSDVAREAGASAIYLVPSTLASYVEMSGDMNDPTGSLVVDIGAGGTDMSVIASNEIIVGRWAPVGGEDMTDVVQRVMDMSYGVRVSRHDAEDIKTKVGVQEYGDEVIVRRRAELSGEEGVSEVNVPVATVAAYLRRCVQPILDGLFGLLEATPAELFEDIYRKGIFLTGGAARTPGLEQLIEERTHMAVRTAGMPEHTVILGIGRLLTDAKFFQTLAHRYVPV